MSVERVSTGIERFDSLIEGGIPRGYLVLLAGHPGSGKTIFASQYLFNGLKLDEPGVYVSFAENRETFLKNMKRLDMDFERYEQEGKFKFLDLITVREKDVEKVFKLILEDIDALKAKRLVVDSFSAMAQAFEEPIEARIVIHTILGKLVRGMGCTALLVVEMPIGQRQMGLGIEEFVADGVVTLTTSNKRGYLDRRAQVLKMRGTKINDAQHSYMIGEHGIGLYQEPEVKPVREVSTERVSTGIESLDRMLNGGFLKGSTTLVAGASGTGKTTTALQFIVEGARRNERSLFVTFEEPVAQIIQYGDGFGWRVKEIMDKGALRYEGYSVEPSNAEECLNSIMDLLQDYRPARFAFDSLTPLERAMSEDRCMRWLKSLIYSLKAEGITAVFTMIGEAGTLTTGTGVSTLLDNIISLRTVELESTLRRSLVIFKARGTAHDRDIREFEITPKGIVVKEKFTGVEQVLGGTPRKSLTEEAARAWASAFGGR